MKSGSNSASDARYVLETNHICVIDDDSNNQQPVQIIDDLMVKAYGGKLLFSDGGDCSSSWCQRWDAIVRLNGKHNVVPGGSVGRHSLMDYLLN